VLLGQLDAVRRELLEITQNNLHRIHFGKEIAREVFSFASAGDTTPRAGVSPAKTHAAPSSAALSKHSSRDRLRGATPRSDPSSTLMGLVTSPKRPPRSPNAPQPSSSYKYAYDNDLWEGANASTSSYRGVSSRGQSGAAVSAPEPERRFRLNFGHATTSSPSSKRIEITDEDIYGPPPPHAAVENRYGDHTARSGAVSAASGGSPRRYGGVLRIKDMLERAEKGLTAVAEAQEQRRNVPRIYGEHEQENKGQWRGMDAVDDDASVPVTPRTLGPVDADNASLWSQHRGVAASARSPTLSYNANTISNINTPLSDWTARGSGAGEVAGRLRNAPSTPRNLDSDGETSDGGLSAVVGKLAGWAFALGSIAAATMVASSSLRGNSSNRTVPMQRRKSKTHRGRNDAVDQVQQQDHRSRGADVPPWKDGTMNRPRRRSADATGDGHHRGSPGSSGRTPGSALYRGRKRDGPVTPVQAPVMHVHQPPASKSFPSNPPPDVTAAMG
jgi:hypothetical protein